MSQSKIWKSLTGEELERVIKKHFGAGKVEYRLLPGGMFNTTYLVNLVSRNRKIVLRAGPVNRELLLPFEHQLMQAEFSFYENCRRVGVPVPRVAACDTGKSLLDRDYMITEYIEAVPLSDESVSDEEKEALYEEAGSFAARINGIPGTVFGRVGDAASGKGFSAWSAFLREEVSQWAGKAAEFQVFPESELEKVQAVFRTYTEILDEIHEPKLVHADLWAGNILVSGTSGRRRLAAVIDGDRAIWGDRDFELASGWLVNPAFLKGYGEISVPDEHALLRKKLYMLLYHVIDSYVWQVEYDNMENSLSEKEKVRQLLAEL